MNQTIIKDYASRLAAVLQNTDWKNVQQLAADLLSIWSSGRQVFLCGNGGSAANALHITNDLLYGVGMPDKKGIRAHALSSNTAVLTCLANDLGYEHIFSAQLAVQAMSGDLLIILSGSGNSSNIIAALEEARSRGIRSYAVLGFNGGIAKALADVSIHFAIDDMQISEDLQLIVGHMITKTLRSEINKR